MKTYLIKVDDDELWEDFVETIIPRKKDINTALVEMIKERVKKMVKISFDRWEKPKKEVKKK